MKVVAIAALAITAATLAACAKTPESIAPSYISDIPYQASLQS